MLTLCIGNGVVVHRIAVCHSAIFADNFSLLVDGCHFVNKGYVHFDVLMLVSAGFDCFNSAEIGGTFLKSVLRADGILASDVQYDCAKRIAERCTPDF